MIIVHEAVVVCCQKSWNKGIFKSMIFVEKAPDLQITG